MDQRHQEKKANCEEHIQKTMALIEKQAQRAEYFASANRSLKSALAEGS